MTDDVLLLAKRAWQTSMDRDDAFAAQHRERRLARGRRRSTRSLRPIRALFVSPVVGVALALLAGSAMATVAGARWIGRTLSGDRPLFGSMFSSTVPSPAPRPSSPRVLERQSVSSTVVVSGALARAEPGTGAPSASEPPARSTVHSSPAVDPEGVWRAAEDALARGDRGRAERLLDSLVSMHTPRELHDRASLSLAELELARGDLVAGRSRLASLAQSTDPAVVADAVFLEARASRREAEQAEIYERYLATSPPSPYLEEAMVERARALLRGGDTAGARACVEELHRLPRLPSIVKSSVADLDRRVVR